jgi:hypothetical protein
MQRASVIVTAGMCKSSMARFERRPPTRYICCGKNAVKIIWSQPQKPVEPTTKKASI